MLKIKNKFGSDINSFDFQKIKTSKVKKFLKEIYIKKAIGVDTIPPKMIKIGADIIPDNAKIASVVPVDKGKPEKYEVLNYRPVCILNTFFKI